MKTSIIINVDTENEPRITFGKPLDHIKPETPEEAKVAIISDIAHVCEGLYTLIEICDQNGYAKKEDLIRVSIESLNSMLKQK